MYLGTVSGNDEMTRLLTLIYFIVTLLGRSTLIGLSVTYCY